MEASRCKRRSKRGSRSSKLRRTNADETPNEGPSRVAIPYLSSSSLQSCPFVHLSQRKAAKTKPKKINPPKPNQTKPNPTQPNPTHYIRQNKKETKFLKFASASNFLYISMIVISSLWSTCTCHHALELIPRGRSDPWEIILWSDWWHGARQESWNWGKNERKLHSMLLSGSLPNKLMYILPNHIFSQWTWAL